MIDIELGEDLLNQVEVTNGPLPEDTKSKNIKFDAKGSLHMMCRDNDGKLLKDVPVKTTEQKASYSDELMREYSEQHEAFVAQNKKTNLLLCLLAGCLVSLMIVAIIFIGMR
jgi:hypothetical protein